MKLIDVQIHKYKSFSESQMFHVEDDITILVGMNESGKTSALEVLAKTNYFQKDEHFEFNLTHDYPRKEKKKLDKSGENPSAVTCTYEIDEDLLSIISEEMGDGVLLTSQINITSKYNNIGHWGNVRVDKDKFVRVQTERLGISSDTLNEKLNTCSSLEDLLKLKTEYTDEKYIEGIASFETFFKNEWKWENDVIGEYITRTHLKPNLPKFLYYDEYFALPARINLERLEKKKSENSEYKTARALIELADINLEEITDSDNFENFIAELEATEAIISQELFKYWQTNKNLQIVFQIDKIEKTDPNNNTRLVEHVLDIRVKNKGVSLSLKNRSKGFNWFFSFLVWFKKIQEDKTSKYILLLDEPGLNLHASAQADLLTFLEDLSTDYQIVYTTHSPFMISPDKLDRVRTVLETESGSVISDSVQEKDPNTLFPLQAALGYDIAQNLFISPKNLLVEGVSDLIFLTTMSSVLESSGRTFLRSDVTIVPTGGLEKVATFISLLRGSKLKIACLLDSFTDPKGKDKMDSLIKDRIIQKNKVRFFDEYLDAYDKADLEDLFTKHDYLKIFNLAFPEFATIDLGSLNSEIKQIIIQINKQLNVQRFNHYRPANILAKTGVTVDFFEKTTLDNFEKVFIDINKLFD